MYKESTNVVVKHLVNRLRDVRTTSNEFRLISYSVDNKYSRMPIVLNLAESDNKLKGIIDYNCDLFDKNTMQTIALKYSMILNEIIDNPLMKIDLIDAKLDIEKNTALDFEFNF